MGCGNTKEAVVIAPADPIAEFQRQQESRAEQEERLRREKEYQKKRDAAKKIADEARQAAMNEIASRLGTLETYWTAGEYESENTKPHFIPVLGPMSLTEKVPPAPAAIRGVILFATTADQYDNTKKSLSPPKPGSSRYLSAVTSPAVANDKHSTNTNDHNLQTTTSNARGILSIGPNPNAPTRSASCPVSSSHAFRYKAPPMPLPRHVRPLFLDDALLQMVKRNQQQQQGGNDSSFGSPSPPTAVAPAAGEGVGVGLVEGNTTPRRRGSHGLLNAQNPLLPPLAPVNVASPAVGGFNVHLLNTTAETSSVTSHAPSLTQHCFLYPSQPFVARAYMSAPLGNKAAGWVRLPCGPVTRKRTTRNNDKKRQQHQGDGGLRNEADNEESSPSPRSVNNRNNHQKEPLADNGGNQNGQQQQQYYFAPEVKGFLSPAKPCYDVKEDGPVDEPIGSHAYEAGGEGDGDDGAALQDGDNVLAAAALPAANHNGDIPLPSIAVRQILPRRLEKYFLYPREVTAMGIALEYRKLAAISTFGDARMMMGMGRSSVKNTLNVGCPSPPLSDPVSRASFALIAKHLLPVAYCCPQPIGLSSFFQSASDYFGEDKPNGLAVKVLRGASPTTKSAMSDDGAALLESTPPTAVGGVSGNAAAGGGVAAVGNLHALGDEKPLEGCFVTFLSPYLQQTQSGQRANKSPPPANNSPSSSVRIPSFLFSPQFMCEENSIPLHVFGDFGGSALPAPPPQVPSSSSASPPPCPEASSPPSSPPLTTSSWWPLAHALAECTVRIRTLSEEVKALRAVVTNKVSRSESAEAEQKRIAFAEEALEGHKATATSAKSALTALQSQGLFLSAEDDIFWLHFKKELCAFLARILEQNVEAAKEEEEGVADDGNLEPAAIISEAVATSTPRDCNDQSYILGTTPMHAPPTAAAAAAGGPSTDGSEQQAYAGDEEDDSTPVSALQLRFSVSAQYNNTHFVAFNGNGKSNVAETENSDHFYHNALSQKGGEEASSLPPQFRLQNSSPATSLIPQWLSFKDSTRRPRAKPFAKPLATGVATIVVPHKIRVNRTQAISAVTHLKYTAGVLALILDEFTASVVVN